MSTATAIATTTPALLQPLLPHSILPAGSAAGQDDDNGAAATSPSTCHVVLHAIPFIPACAASATAAQAGADAAAASCGTATAAIAAISSSAATSGKRVRAKTQGAPTDIGDRLCKDWAISLDPSVLLEHHGGGGSGDFPWKLVFASKRMGPVSLCHFHIRDEGSPHVLGCFCRFKSNWTQRVIAEKLAEYKCIAVQKLSSRFASVDPNFVHLAKTRRLVYEFGFDKERDYYENQAGATSVKGSTTTAAIHATPQNTLVRFSGAHPPATATATASSSFSTTSVSSQLCIPGVAQQQQQQQQQYQGNPAAATKKRDAAKMGGGGGSKHAGKENKRRCTSSSSSSSSSSSGSEQSGCSSTPSDGEEGKEEEQEGEEDEEEDDGDQGGDDLLSAVRKLNGKRERGGKEGGGGSDSDEGGGNDGDSDSRRRRLSGYKKLCRRKDKDLQRAEGRCRELEDRIQKLESDLSASREKVATVRGHLLRLVGDMSKVASAARTLHAFRESNAVYNNYVHKVPSSQQQQQPASSADSGGTSSAASGRDGGVPHALPSSSSSSSSSSYMGGLYAPPKGFSSSCSAARSR